LLARPFEVWLASYMLLQVIERKEIVGWINYILLGTNAFASLAAIYGMVVGKSDSTLGNVFGQGLGAMLIASSTAIWVLWIFTGFYYNMCNNRRGVTISLSNMKRVDRIMLFFVVPVSMLISLIEIMTSLTVNIGKLFHNAGITVLFFVCIIIIGLNIWYLIVLKDRLNNYIVFGKKEVEVWKGKRQRIYKYTNISGVEQLELRTHFSCKYKLTLSKNDTEEIVTVDDGRIEDVLNELLKVNNKSRK